MCVDDRRERMITESTITGATLLGGHAIKIVGWGEEEQNGKQLKYWIVANSWDTT